MESILGKGTKSNWFKDWVCDEIARGCNPTICVRFDHKIRVSDDFFDFLTRFYGMANSILLIVLMRPFLKPILRVWTAMKLASKSVYQYLMEAVWKKLSETTNVNKALRKSLPNNPPFSYQLINQITIKSSL